MPQDFVNQNLSGRRFRQDEDLKGADFSGANLRGANFEKLNLYGAKFNNADIRGASGSISSFAVEK